MKNSDKSKYVIVKDLMKHRLTDAIKCTESAKKELNFSKDSLDKVVRKGTLVRQEFMDLVDKELNYVWKEAKVKSQEKIDWNIQKRKVKTTQNGTHKDVLVGDEELERYEKEMSDNNSDKSEDKAIVYAGIKINKKENDILCLPPDHAIFPKVDLEEFDTEMEKCVIKCIWQAKNEERKAEDMKVREEASEEDDDAHKVILDSRSLNFRNMLPTDFKNNKRIVIPDAHDDPEEIK